MSFAGSPFAAAPFAGSAGGGRVVTLGRATSGSRVGGLVLYAFRMHRVEGRARIGLGVPIELDRVVAYGRPAVLGVEPVVVPLPARYADALAMRRDKTFAYPTPVLVDGRIVDEAVSA